MNASMIRGFLKIVVLKALAEGPKSGYSLMKFVEEKTGSKPSPGSMYPLLDVLKNESLVSVKSVGRTNEFSLTAEGKQKLHAIEAKRAEFTNSFVEGMKVLSAMTGENMSVPAGVVESLRKGEVPFKELNPEMASFHSEMHKLFRKGLVKEKASRIKRILADAVRELRSV